jgi:hypothetical protein
MARDELPTGVDVTGSNRLAVLEAAIVAAHQAVETATRTAFDKAIEAGQLLLEARESVPHGGWLPWVRGLGITVRTAQRYMQLARLPDAKSATVAHLGIKAALAEIAHHATPLALLHDVDELVDRATELQDRIDAVDPHSMERVVLLADAIRLSERIIDGMVVQKRAALHWFRELFGDTGRRLICNRPNDRDIAILKRLIAERWNDPVAWLEIEEAGIACEAMVELQEEIDRKLRTLSACAGARHSI